jgi:predicted transcriptional regulator
MTTIKVPRDLRDRLAVLAKGSHTSMAGVIDHAITEAQDRDFWSAVRRSNAEISDDERRAALRDPTLMDNLADAADDARSRNDAW